MIKTYTNRHGRVFQAQQHEMFDRLTTGIYQITNLRRMRDLVPRARTIIDVGAHVGTTTMEYATWAQRVEAFEADPDTFYLLTHNVNFNRNLPPGQPWYHDHVPQIQAQIQCHNRALMNRQDTLYITRRERGLASFVSAQGDLQVPAEPLDSYGFTQVDAIKIDTEGTEWLVIQGAHKTIERDRPVVQVEMWGWERRFGINNQDMLDYFRDLDYDQTDAYGRPMPWDHPGRYTKAMGAGRSAMDRFFVPR